MRARAFAAAVLLAAVTTGCSGGEEGSVSKSTSTAVTEEQTSSTAADVEETSESPTPTPTETPTPTPTDDPIATFDQVFTFTDGLEVTVTKPAAHKFSQYAAGNQPGGVDIAFKVKIVNKTGSTFDPSLLTVDAVAGPEGEAGEQVYDQGFDGAGDAKITAGRSATYKLGMSFPKGTSLHPLQIQVTPSFDYEAAIFEAK